MKYPLREQRESPKEDGSRFGRLALSRRSVWLSLPSRQVIIVSCAGAVSEMTACIQVGDTLPPYNFPAPDWRPFFVKHMYGHTAMNHHETGLSMPKKPGINGAWLDLCPRADKRAIDRSFEKKPYDSW